MLRQLLSDTRPQAPFFSHELAANTALLHKPVASHLLLGACPEMLLYKCIFHDGLAFLTLHVLHVLIAHLSVLLKFGNVLFCTANGAQHLSVGTFFIVVCHFAVLQQLPAAHQLASELKLLQSLLNRSRERSFLWRWAACWALIHLGCVCVEALAAKRNSALLAARGVREDVRANTANEVFCNLANYSSL
jgi:hypothetical protein